MSCLLYISSGVLRYLGLELAMRPVLRDIGEQFPGASIPDSARVSLHQRLLATVPMVTWGASLIVAGLMTPNTRNLDTIGLASGVAVGVTAAFSIWLSLVLADSVSGPIIDLRNAARRLGTGDLAVHVPSCPPMKRANSRQRSMRWWPGCASGSGCTRRSVYLSIQP